MERMSNSDRVSFRARKKMPAGIPHGVIENKIVEPGLFPGQAPITTIDAMYITEAACKVAEDAAKKG